MAEAVEVMGGRVKRSRSWIRSLPSSQFRKDPWFYLKYDVIWMLLFGVSAALMTAAGWRGAELTLSWWLIPLLLGSCYIQVLAGVCVHNASHQNFPRPINRLCGEISGAIVGTRFASWEILHRRHHMYSDDVEKDPHPNLPGFFGFFVRRMLMNLERNLRQQYLELWGDTPVMRRRDTVRSVVSMLTMVPLLGFWYTLLGQVGFFLVFLPGLVFGALHVSHFNWVTHNAKAKTGDYHPVNVDSGPYWLANRVLFGLYMHANHHAFVRLFNPLKLDGKKLERVERAQQARLANPVLPATPSGESA